VLTLIGGVGFMLLFFVAMAIWSAPLVDIPENRSDALAQAQAFLHNDDIGWVILGGSGVCAGLMILAVSSAAMRARKLPSWVGWLSVFLGIVSLGTVAFVGIFAWLAWIGLASIGMLLAARRPAILKRVSE